MISKSIFKSKTFWLNVVGILGLAEETFRGNEQVAKWIGFGLGVANIILRYVSTEPVHITEPKE